MTLVLVEFLEVWKTFQENWCEHKPSVTISVAEDEWLPVAAWVYDNFDILSGVSFLPFDPTEYPQAPYQTLTEEQYKEFLKKCRKPLTGPGLQNMRWKITQQEAKSWIRVPAGGLCEV
jgi:hypothetical protein